MSDVYQENGFKSREDYLMSLAKKYNTDIRLLHTLADIMGPEQDFDGLVTMLNDYGALINEE